jgi:tripartite-type tricarboxylate transporter receptor subunit TctC
VKAAFANAAFRERLAVLGADPVLDTPAEFKVFVANDIRKYQEMVRLAKIEPE